MRNLRLRRFVAGTLALIMFNMNIFSYGEVIEELSSIIHEDETTNSATENKGCQTKHNWDEGEVTTEATCTDKGEITYTCTDCEETKTEEIDMLDHDWDEGNTTTEPTCTTVGEMTYTCIECDETKAEEIDMLEHNWDEGNTTTEPTCTTIGEITYTCIDCEETKTEEKDMLDHNWDEGTTTVEATCTVAGEKVYTCEDCTTTKTEEIDMLDHNWDEGTTTVEATCTTEGEKVYTCSDCTTTKTEEIDMLDHNWDEGTTTVEATCTVAGEKIYTCSECTTTKTEEIDMLEHNWDEGTVTVEATCTVAGEKIYTCSECTTTKTEEIDMLDHNWDEGTTVEATCTTEGEKVYTCSDCSTTKTEKIDMLGHDWNEGIVTTEATEEATGEKTYTCNVCFVTKTEELPKINVGDGVLDIPQTENNTTVGDGALDIPQTEPEVTEPETPYLVIDPNGSTEYIEMGEIINIITNFDEGTAVSFAWRETNEITEDIYWTELVGNELEFEPYGEETYLFIKGIKNGEEIITVSNAYMFDVEAFMQAWDVSTYEYVESTTLTISTPTIEYKEEIDSKEATVSFTISSSTTTAKTLKIYDSSSNEVNVQFTGFNETKSGSQNITAIITAIGTYTIELIDETGYKRQNFTISENTTILLEVDNSPKAGYFLGDTSDISAGTLKYGTTFKTTASGISMEDARVTVGNIDTSTTGTKTISVLYNDGTLELSTSFKVEVTDGCVIFTPNGSEDYMEAEEPIGVLTDFDIGTLVYYAWGMSKDSSKFTNEDWKPLTKPEVGLVPKGPENYLFVKGIKNGNEKIEVSEKYKFYAPMTGMEIISVPTRTVYNEGTTTLTAQDYAGLVLNFTYDIGQDEPGRKEVRYEDFTTNSVEYSTSISGTIGVEKLTISHTDKVSGETFTDSFYITINTTSHPNTLVNSPEVAEGMLPVKWIEAEQKWMITTAEDSNWYDYTTGTNKWANIMLKDDLVLQKYDNLEATQEELAGKIVETMGSMFVWIPRYNVTFVNGKLNGVEDKGYALQSKTSDGGNGETNFVVYSNISWVKGTTGTALPAFKFGSKNIAGFWMSKFEASDNSGYIKIAPDTTAITSIGLSNAFDSSLEMMTSDKTYYGVEETVIDSHLTRNSEWAAVAFLTNGSTDGGTTFTGKIPYINNLQKTGYAATGLSYGTAYPYNTIQGQKGSTTHNIYGIYDMSGGVAEYVAGYFYADEFEEESGITINSTYWDKLSLNSEGHALNEVSYANEYATEDEGLNGFYLYYDLNEIIDGDMCYIPFEGDGEYMLVRGNYYNEKIEAGIFSIYSDDKVKSHIGYRPTIVLADGAQEKDLEINMTLVSNNANFPTQAKVGDKITATITSNKSINITDDMVTITVGGEPVKGTWVKKGDFGNWTIEYTFIDTDKSGWVEVIISDIINGTEDLVNDENNQVLFTNGDVAGEDESEKPLDLTHTPTAPTNGAVTIEIITREDLTIIDKKYVSLKELTDNNIPENDESIKEYLVENGKFISGNSFDVTKNDKYYVVVTDQAGNKYIENEVIGNIDLTIPTLKITNYDTDNTSHANFAKNGDTVTVEMESSKEIYTIPAVTIGGREADTVVWANGTKTGYATYTIPSNEEDLVEGLLTVSISGYVDIAGNNGQPVTATADEAGNTVTYDRTQVQPTIVLKTSNTYTKQNNEIYYEVTFSDTNFDEDKLDMTADDFEIVVTEGEITNHVITVAAGDNKVYVKEIQGEGTFVLKLLGVNAVGHTPADDMAGNKTAELESSDSIYVDTVQPEFTEISIKSNNSNEDDIPTYYATNGNTITLNITAREEVTLPTVTIMGRTAIVKDENEDEPDHKKFIATYEIPADEIALQEGQVWFEISNYDEYGETFNNPGKTHSEVTDGSKVIYDRTSPVITLTPNENETYKNSHSTVIKVTDSPAGLKLNTVEYAWSTSNVDIPASWEDEATLSDGQATIIGTGYTGTYYLWIKELSDKAGNVNSYISGAFNFDNTNPGLEKDELDPSKDKVEFVSNNANPIYATNGNIITLTFTTTEEVSIISAKIAGRVATIETLDNKSFIATYQIPTGESVLAQGNVGYEVSFKDEAGNTTSISGDGIEYDRTNPLVTITPNGDLTYKTSHDAVVTIEDENSGLLTTTFYYAWSTSNKTVPTFTETFTNGGTITGTGYTGTYYLWIDQVSDNAGNVTGPVVSDAFNFDNGKPTMEIKSIKSNNENVSYAKNGETVTVYLQTNEAIYTLPTVTIGGKTVSAEKVFWTIGETAGSAEVECDSTMPEGILTVVVSGYKDIAGVAGDTVTATIATDGSSVHYDRTAPEISLSPNTNTTTQKSHTTTLTITDRTSGLASDIAYYAWSTSNTDEPTGWTPVSLTKTYDSTDKEYTYTASIEGNGLDGTQYLWIKELSDKAGNTDKHTSAAFSFDTTKPSITNITATPVGDPAYVKTGDTVTVTITASEGIYTVPTVKISGKEADVTWTTGESTGTAVVECNLTMPEGYLEVRISGYKDISENEGDLVEEQLNIYYDRTTPYNLTIIGTHNTDGSATLTGTATDNTIIEQYDWTKNEETISWAEVENPGSEVTIGCDIEITEGMYHFHVKDKAGNEKSTSKEVYKIAYDANGGSGAPDAQYKVEGVDLKLSSTVPVKTGYIFKGWETEGSIYQAGSTFTQNESVTLTAKWEEYKLTVHFDAVTNGGVASYASKYVTYGEAYGTLATATRTGYAFNGWFTDATGGTEITADTTVSITADQTLYAQFTANTYTVKYNANKPSNASGSIAGTTADSTHTYDVAKELTQNGYSLTGWTFAGWNTLPNGTGIGYADKESVINLITNGEVTLYAQWTANTYTVKYNANKPANATSTVNGTVSDSTHVYDVSSNLNKNTYTLAGWNFTGWNTKADGTGTAYGDQHLVVNLTSTNGEIVTIYAQWTKVPVNVTIVHYLQNADNDEYTLFKTEVKTEIAEETITLADYIISEGDLAYTKTNEVVGKVGDTVVTETTVLADGSLVIELYYIRNTYDLTLKIGSYISNVKYQGKVNATTEETSTSDVTKSFRWGETVDIDATVESSVTGYTNLWSKWTSSNPGLIGEITDKDTTITMPKDGIALTANGIRTSKEIEVTFNASENGGTIIGSTSKKVTFDGVYGDLPSAEKTGYTFNGWYTAKTGGTKVISSTSVSTIATTAENHTLYAQFTAGTVMYKVEHHLENANNTDYTLYKSEIKSKIAGTEITLANEKVAEGDLVYADYKESKIDDVVSTTTTIAADGSTVIKLYYTRKTATLVLDKNEYISSVTGAGTYKWGQSISITATLGESEGYTYKWLSWESSNAGLLSEQSTQNTTIALPKELTVEPTPTITLTAKGTMEADVCTITFNSNGGTASYTSKTVEYSSKIGEFPSVEKIGYTLKGWYTEGGTEVTSDTVVIADIEVFAQWIANTYYVKYDGNGATSGSMSNSTHTYDVEKALTANGYSKTGYTFNGWKSETGIAYTDGATVKNLTSVNMVTITMYAQWAVNAPYTVTLDNQGATTAGTTSVTVTYDADMPAITIPEKEYTVTFNYGEGTGTPASSDSQYTFNGYYESTNGGGTKYYTAAGTSAYKWDKASDATIYAYWTPESISLPTPTKVGYIFNGWYTAAEGGTFVGIAGTNYIPLGDIELYAQWTLINNGTATLEYEKNTTDEVTGMPDPLSESVTLTGTKYSHTFIITDATPGRIGYEFLGWSTRDGKIFTADEEIIVGNETVKLYAVWSLKNNGTAILIYDANGGTGAPDTQTYKLTGTETSHIFTISEKVPVKEGQTFLKWNTKQDGTGTNYNSNGNITVGNETVTLYAQWEEKNNGTATLVYDDNTEETVTGMPDPLSDSVELTGTKTYHTFTITSATPERVGYNFLGWSTSMGATVASYTAGGTITVGNETVTLYAVWSLKENGTAILTYDANRGSNAPDTQTHKLTGTETSYIFTVSGKVPTYAGHTFVIWNTQADGSGDEYSAGDQITVGNETVTLYAQWEEKNNGTATLVYDKNTTEEVTEMPDPLTETEELTGTKTYHTFTITNAEPERTGYEFLGWSTSTGATAATYTSDGKIMVGNETIDLYAVWQANTTLITLEQTDATTLGTTFVTATYSKDMPRIIVPIREYVVTYDYNYSGKANETAEYVFEFIGYFDEDDDTQYYNADGISTRIWDKIDEMATLHADWSSPADLTLPSVPTRSGYSFEGWYNGETKIGDAGDSYAPLASVKLTAKWTSSMGSYVVEHYIDGDLYKTETKEALVGATITLADEVSAEGELAYAVYERGVVVHNGHSYVAGECFCGAIEGQLNVGDSDENGRFYGDVDGDGNVTEDDATNLLYYTFLPDEYGDILIEDLDIYGDIDHDGDVDSDDACILSDYVGGVAEVTQAIVLSDGSLVIKLYYTTDDVETATLVYDKNTTDTVTNMPNPSTQTAALAGETYTFTISDNVPRRAGYEFVGWNTEANGTGTTYDSTISVGNETVTLYAQWEVEIVTYTVRHYLQNADNDNYILYLSDIKEAETDETITLANEVSNEGDLAYANYLEGKVGTEIVTETEVLGSGRTIIKLYYTRATYNLVLKAESGALISDTTHRWGEKITIDANVEASVNPAYTNVWDRWVSSNVGLVPHQTDKNTVIVMPKGNVTLTATCKLVPKTYVVTFDATGGISYYNTKNVTFDSPYGDLPNAVLDGYALNGWFTAPEGGTQIQPTTKVSVASNHTLYAQWTKLQGSVVPPAMVTYTVEHYLENADNTEYTLQTTETKTALANSTVILSNILSDTDDLIYATYKEGKVNDVVVTQTSVLEDGSLVIKLYYTRNQYKLELVLEDVVSQESTYKWGEEIAISATLMSQAADGYIWAGWKSSDTDLVPDQANESTTITMPKGNVTLTAIAGVASDYVTITYSGLGKTQVIKKYNSTDNNGSYLLKDIPEVASGKSFRGWATTNGATVAEYKVGAWVELTQNITLYPVAVTSLATGALFAGADVGAYVTYVPVETSYTATTTATNWTSNQTYNPARTTNWRVFSNDGINVEIISDEAVGDLTLNGAIAYLSMIQTLQDVAQAYIHPAYAESARHLGYSEEGLTAEEIEQYKVIPGTLSADKSGFPYIDTQSIYDINQITANKSLITAETRPWIASRQIYKSGDVAYFRGCYMSKDGNVYINNLSVIPGGTVTGTRGIRPIVKLKQGLIVGGGDGSPENPYVLVDSNKTLITYNANGGTGAPAIQTVTPGSSVYLSETIPTAPAGKAFRGWATRSNATVADYKPGAYIENASNMTLYAVYVTPLATGVAFTDADVGAYVTYKPSTTSTTVLATKSGYDSNQTFNPSNTTNWRVFSKDGTNVEIIPDESAGHLIVQGETGYINYVQTLQTIATSYKNSAWAVSARALGYSEEGLTAAQITNYKTINTTTYPLELEVADGTFPYSDTQYTRDLGVLQNTGSLKIKDHENEYEWLASRNSQYISQYACTVYGIVAFKNTGEVTSNNILYWSDDGAEQVYYAGVRPIVKLQEGLTVASGDGSPNNPYVLQKTVTVTYDANGGTGAIASQTQIMTTLSDAPEFTLSTDYPTAPSGMAFRGWSTMPNPSLTNTRPIGSKVGYNNDTTLYAYYAPVVYPGDALLCVDVGAYVTYVADADEIYVPEEITGYTREQPFNTRTEAATKWRLYNSVDGLTEIISADGVGDLVIGGAEGYSHYVGILQGVSDMYGQNENAIGVRSFGYSVLNQDGMELAGSEAASVVTDEYIFLTGQRIPISEDLELTADEKSNYIAIDTNEYPLGYDIDTRGMPYTDGQILYDYATTLQYKMWLLSSEEYWVASRIANNNNYSVTVMGGKDGEKVVTLYSANSNTEGTAQYYTAKVRPIVTLREGIRVVSGDGSPNNPYVLEGTEGYVRLTYHANGGVGAPTMQGMLTGSTITISNTVPAREGYTFLGWGTSSTATTPTYQPGDSIMLNGNRTLYAVWKGKILTYNANGGSGAPESQEGVEMTISNVIPTAPAGKAFRGWSTSANSTSAEYKPGASITLTENTTLYAVYVTPLASGAAFTGVDIGASVTYVPSSTSYTVATTASGYASDQTYNPSTITSWRVFSKNGTTVEIISDESVGDLYLTGSTGYINVVQTLQDISAAYVNGTYATSARHLGYSEDGLTQEEIANYKVFDTSKYPLKYSGSVFSKEPYSDSQDRGDKEKINSYDLTRHNDGWVWLASHKCGLIMGGNMYFGIGTAGNSGSKYDTNNVCCADASGNITGEFTKSAGVRPIVTLKSTLKVQSGDGSPNNPYVLTN